LITNISINKVMLLLLVLNRHFVHLHNMYMKTDLAVSNVRGPDETVHVCGKPVSYMFKFFTSWLIVIAKQRKKMIL
jgi:hypothetical protein